MAQTQNYEIVYNGHQVKIKTQKVVETVDGRFLPDGPGFGVAMAIGDIAADPLNPTQEEINKHQERVSAMVELHIGKSNAELLADKHALLLERDALRAEHTKEKTRADKAEKELNDLRIRAEAAEAERDEIKTTNNFLQKELYVKKLKQVKTE